jgi:uncharacterized protein (TIGR02597 family)
MMKTSKKFIALLSGAALLTSCAFAQTVATDPVGYVTVETNANSDSKSGIALLRPSALSSSVSVVSTNTVTASGAFGDVTTNIHYLSFNSGALASQWFQVLSTSGNDLTLSADVSAATSGDSFEVRPFWTLDSLFPSGEGIPASADVDSPVSFVLLNNPEAEGTNHAPTGVFFYHDGSQGPAGWYNFDGLASAGSQPLSPDSFITIRNLTGAPIATVVAGTVPVNVIGNSVLSRSAGSQDSLVYNPYPASITLGSSNLILSGVVRESPDVDNPVDFVLLYSDDINGTNPAPTGVFFYHDGSQGPEGWYNFDGLASADSLAIPAGAPIVIRRSVGTDVLVSWNPPTPYTL